MTFTLRYNEGLTGSNVWHINDCGTVSATVKTTDVAKVVGVCVNPSKVAVSRISENVWRVASADYDRFMRCTLDLIGAPDHVSARLSSMR